MLSIARARVFCRAATRAGCSLPSCEQNTRQPNCPYGNENKLTAWLVAFSELYEWPAPRKPRRAPRRSTWRRSIGHPQHPNPQSTAFRILPVRVRHRRRARHLWRKNRRRRPRGVSDPDPVWVFTLWCDPPSRSECESSSTSTTTGLRPPSWFTSASRRASTASSRRFASTIAPCEQNTTSI